MPLLRHLLSSLAAFLALAVSPARATEAGELLPADTKVIVTLNLRRILSDHRDMQPVQRYLDQWRLALKGDQKQLKNYYRLQELNKSEGISEPAFLARAKTIKTVSDALGIDPLEDIDQITLGFNGGGPVQANKPGFVALILEGRFKQEKFKAAIPQIGTDYFGSFKLTPPGEVWQIPADPDGWHVSMVDARTLAITDSKNTMHGLLAMARGKQKEGLPPGIRTLLDSVRKEQVGVVLADVDLLLNDLVRFLKSEVVKSVRADDAVGKFIVTQGVDAIQKCASEISSVGLGSSFREDGFRLQLGLDVRMPTIAKGLHAQIQRSTFWSALALKAGDNEFVQGLANILARQRIALKETTIITQTEIPYDFVKLVANGPDLNAALAQTAMDALSTRITSIPLWTLPTGDKTKAPPTATFDVLEVRDVAYKSGLADPFRHRLDMYLPKDKKNFPVVVLVHGGSWTMGDNRCCGLYSSVGQFLASQGIGVVMPNYRLSPAVKHPEHAKDIARAVAWTRANIGKHGGDPQRLYLAGHSAGGHLVALLGTDETYLRAAGMKTADIKGVIAISGVYRIPLGETWFSIGGSGSRAARFEQVFPFRGDTPPTFKNQLAFLPGVPVQSEIFAPVFGNTPRECDLASPVAHVRKGIPPVLILVAEHDLPSLSEMASEFHQALLRHGCEVKLLKIAKRNHHSLMFSVIRRDDPAAHAIVQFIRK